MSKSRKLAGVIASVALLAACKTAQSDTAPAAAGDTAPATAGGGTTGGSGGGSGGSSQGTGSRGTGK